VSDVALVHLPQQAIFPPTFKKLLELPNMVARGRQVGGDVLRVREKGVSFRY
jgi:hypothetical protein